MTLKSIFKDTLIYSTASLIAKGIGFFLIPLYTRLLSATDYGIIDLLNVYMAYSFVIFGGELVQGVARFLPEMPTESEKAACASTVLMAMTSSFVVFAALNLTFAHVISAVLLKSGESAGYLRLATPLIVINALLEACQAQLRYDLKPRQYSLVSVLVVLVSLSTTVLLVLVLRLGVRGFILGQTAGVAVGFGASLIFSRRRFKFMLSTKLLRSMLKFSLPLVPSSISVLVWTYIDRIIISRYLSIADLGIYGIGVRFASIASMMIMGMNMALTPIIYASYRDQETPRRISDLFSLFVLLMCLVLGGVILFSREVLMIMTTPQFYGAAGVIPFLMAGALLSQMYNFAPGVFIAKKTYLILVVNVIACGLSLVLNLILIPRLGITGAAITNSIIGLTVFTMYVTLGQREYRIAYRIGDIAIALATVTAAYLLLRLTYLGTGGPSVPSILLKVLAFVLLGIMPALRIVPLVRGALSSAGNHFFLRWKT